jgi:MFS family permease
MTPRQKAASVLRLFPRLRSVYYGWIMLFTVAVTNVVSWGILYYAYSVFVTPLEQALQASRTEIAAGYSIMLFSSGVAAVPVGRWLDRYGPRWVMTIGSLTAVVALIGWSAVTSLLQYYLVMALIGVTTAAVLYEPAFTVVAVWFRRLRGRALAILTFFGAWASTLFIPLTNLLTEQFGWRAALLILAAVLACLTIVPHALVLRRRPQDLGLLPDGDAQPSADAAQPLPAAERSLTPRDALHDAGFWLLVIAFGVSTFATVAVTVHLIPYLTERGSPASFAATVAGLNGIMSLAGRVLLGPLGDRWPRRIVIAGLLLMMMFGLAALALWHADAGALVFITLFGAGQGTLTIMRAAIIAERYGPAAYATISGTQNILLTAARMAAPVGAGWLALSLGGYDALWLSMVVLIAVGLFAVLRLPPHRLPPAAD